MQKLRISDITCTDSRILPGIIGEGRVTHGGVHVFKPGETAHPEPVHVHETTEIFFFIQGKGVLPIDGVEHPVETGDVYIVEAGEDHHTRSSVEDPLVAAWWVLDT
jgi:mannose-6-phosphate isomerase-like protein (cupin superfamily)